MEIFYPHTTLYQGRIYYMLYMSLTIHFFITTRNASKTIHGYGSGK